tara:strand:+ start:5400 stop:5690 length:291 start_codon:yes stop_codon:yes gene_type:complete
MTEKRKYRTYTQEFKDKAVRLVLEHNYSLKEASETVGVTAKILSNWKVKYEKNQAEGALRPEERAELMRLRRENKRLQQEHEILKKASAFFAKEMK